MYYGTVLTVLSYSPCHPEYIVELQDNIPITEFPDWEELTNPKSLPLTTHSTATAQPFDHERIIVSDFPQVTYIICLGAFLIFLSAFLFSLLLEIPWSINIINIIPLRYSIYRQRKGSLFCENRNLVSMPSCSPLSLQALEHLRKARRYINMILLRPCVNYIVGFLNARRGE